jgi:molecular chaperone DnaK
MKIGIDLGTTNSAAARCSADGRSPEIILLAGEPLMPSVVSIAHGEMIVGREALNNTARAPVDTIASVKRLMGRDYADEQIERIRGRFSYKIVPGSDGDPRVYVEQGGETLSPAAVSSRILAEIKAEAERTLNDEVTHAVITVPAYFTEAQRAATREAGQLAGLVVTRIIDEPTAAAIAFGVDVSEGERHRVLVFDMGGGTFDISIVQMVKDDKGRDQHQGLQIEGDNWLGGDDFDFCIVDRVMEWVRSEHGADMSGDPRFLPLVKQHAEQAKRALSSKQKTDIVILGGARLPNGAFIDVELTLTRTEFEQMIEPQVSRAMDLVAKGLAGQGLKPEDITDVLLVGGTTLTPVVYKRIEALFGSAKVRRHISPMQCVALGAGVLAATLRGVACPACGQLNEDVEKRCEKCDADLAAARSVGDTVLQDPTPMSLGIRAVKGDDQDHFVPIIPKGTVYPLTEPMKRSFEATSDRKISIPVFEGDDPVASRNHEQGMIEYELPEGMDVRTRVEVSFNYDRNRELTVTVAAPGTAFLKSQKVARGGPRSDAPAGAPREEGADAPVLDLQQTAAMAGRFHSEYERFMEMSQAMRLRREIEAAERLLAEHAPDEEQARHQARVIETAIFSSGLATQLFVANQATDGAPPELSAQINEVAAAVRQSWEREQKDVASRQAAQLRTLVARAMQPRDDIKEVADQADYGGLLRALGQ